MWFCQHRSVQKSPRHGFCCCQWVGGNFLRASSPCYGLISAVRRGVPWQFFFLKLRPFESSWFTLPETNSSPLQIGLNAPKRERIEIPRIHFSGALAVAVRFREGYSKLLWIQGIDWTARMVSVIWQDLVLAAKFVIFFLKSSQTGAITRIFATVWWNAVLGRIQLLIEYTLENEHGTKNITPLKMKFIFQTSIFGFHINFSGCRSLFMSVARSNPGSEDHDKTISEDEWVWALRCVCSVFF